MAFGSWEAEVYRLCDVEYITPFHASHRSIIFKCAPKELWGDLPTQIEGENLPQKITAALEPALL
jgi:hypothetical protein